MDDLLAVHSAVGVANPADARATRLLHARRFNVLVVGDASQARTSLLTNYRTSVLCAGATHACIAPYSNEANVPCASNELLVDVFDLTPPRTVRLRLVTDALDAFSALEHQHSAASSRLGLGALSSARAPDMLQYHVDAFVMLFDGTSRASFERLRDTVAPRVLEYAQRQGGAPPCVLAILENYWAVRQRALRDTATEELAPLCRQYNALYLRRNVNARDDCAHAVRAVLSAAVECTRVFIDQHVDALSPQRAAATAVTPRLPDPSPPPPSFASTRASLQQQYQRRSWLASMFGTCFPAAVAAASANSSTTPGSSTTIATPLFLPEALRERADARFALQKHQ